MTRRSTMSLDLKAVEWQKWVESQIHSRFKNEMRKKFSVYVQNYICVSSYQVGFSFTVVPYDATSSFEVNLLVDASLERHDTFKAMKAMINKAEALIRLGI